jgi:hypothetical protein
MVGIRHHVADAKYRKPDGGAASVIYNATHHTNQMHGIISAAREVSDTTRHLCDGSHLILSQRVEGSARGIRAVRNTRGFQTETTLVADGSSSLCIV